MTRRTCVEYDEAQVKRVQILTKISELINEMTADDKEQVLTLRSELKELLQAYHNM
jgi:hypothetical protein